MRISGGAARGISLRASKGLSVRPATDGLRQSVFSSLGARVAGAQFLDLFAGTGAYGLEALSRGAAGGTFVERDAKTVECLRRDIAAVCKSLGRDERGIAVVQADVLSAPFDGTASDLVFVAPTSMGGRVEPKGLLKGQYQAMILEKYRGSKEVK